MADTVCQLVDDPAMRASYGHAAVQRVQHSFSPTKAGKDFSDVLRKVAHVR